MQRRANRGIARLKVAKSLGRAASSKNLGIRREARLATVVEKKEERDRKKKHEINLDYVQF